MTIARPIALFIILLICIMLSTCTLTPYDSIDKSLPSVNTKSDIITHVDLGFKRKIQTKGTLEDSLPMAVPGEGLGMVLYDVNGNQISEDILSMREHLQLYLTLYNYIPNEVSYKLIHFIDFIQNPIAIDDKSYENGFDFVMPANSIVDIPISINITEKGLHEVLIIFVVDSENKSLDRNYRFDTNMNHLFMCRFLVENNNSSVIPYPIVYNETKSIEFKVSNLNFLMLTELKDKLVPWLSKTVKPNVEIPCFLHIGSGHEKSKTNYAVILLNEWNQAEITDNKSVLFLELNPDNEVIIPTKIVMPAKEGIYDVTPIIVPNPYDVSSTTLARTSFRTGIQVIVPNE